MCSCRSDSLVTFVAALLVATLPVQGQYFRQTCDGESPTIVQIDGPLLPTRTFNSKLNLVVSAPSKGGENKFIGLTPSRESMNIPSCQVWFVTPNGAVDMEALAQEMQSESIPGFLQVSPKDSVLGALRDLKEMLSLDIRGSGGVTDAGLVYLKGMSGLRSLDISSTDVTDAGLLSLKDLTGLRYLNIGYTKVTNGGLANLKNLIRLQVLSLTQTKVTDAGLVNLRNLGGLRALDLFGTQVTDACLFCGNAELSLTFAPTAWM